MDQAIVSIITPSFNRADLVDQTAQSIFNQTSPYWEWIIVEDGSTDNSMEILKQYVQQDNRVKLYERNRLPKGACTCRNIGVEFCSGEYVMFLDTDDIIEPFCIEQRIKAIQSDSDLAFAIFPSLMFCEKPYDMNRWWNIDKETPEIIRQLHQDAICQGTGVLWTKEAFIRIGMWDAALYLWQDIDLFLRAYIQNYKYKKFFDLPPDLHNRVTDTSLSRGNFFAVEKQKSRIKVIKNAVQLLNTFGKQHLKPEVKYMLAEIASGLIRSNLFLLAKELVSWGKEEEILNEEDLRSLKKLKFIYQFKLYKLPFIKNIIDSINKRFEVPRTLGTIPYTN